MKQLFFTLCLLYPLLAAPKKLIFNQDNSEFFIESFGPVKPETVDAYVKTIGGKAVTDFFVCINAQRTNYRSAVWEADWDGYDPSGGDQQSFFAGIGPDRAFERQWTRWSYDWSRFNVDYPARMLAAIKVSGMRGWISVRMNDAHYPKQSLHPYHSRFWRQHPEWHLSDGSLDYSQKAVRDHYLALIREAVARFPADGLELDFMRHGHYFRPENTHDGSRLMTEFVREVRRLAEEQSKRRGAKIRIAVRVPSTPWISTQRGLEAIEWARSGLVDLVIASPWWASTQSDVPVESWRGQLIGTKVEVAVALEDGISSGETKRRTMTVEESRGVALGALARGADAIYLFNLFTGPLQKWSRDEYQGFLRTAADMDKLQQLPRRHAITAVDPWTPGEPGPSAPLRDPVSYLRFFTGPIQSNDVVDIALTSDKDLSGIRIMVNGHSAQFRSRDGETSIFRAPANKMRDGYNLLSFAEPGGIQLRWAEVRLRK